MHAFIAAVTAVASSCQRVPDSNQATELGLVPDMTIGGSGAAEPFAEIMHVAAGPDGCIYVADWQAGDVRIFDEGGQFINDLGLQGSGPGELLRPVRLGWQDDYLWVLDIGNGRIPLYREGRTYTSQQPAIIAVRNGSQSGSVAVYGLDAGGGLVAEPTYNVTRLAAGHDTTIAVLRVTGGGAILDTIGWRELRKEALDLRFGAQAGATVRSPISESTIMAMAPSGEALVLVERPAATRPGVNHYTVTKMGYEGDTIFSAAVEYTPVEVASVNWDSIVEAETPATIGDRNRAMRVYKEALLAELASYVPPVTHVSLTSDGRTWVRREDLGVGVVQWEVLDAHGGVEGTATVSRTVRIFESRGSFAWGIATGDLDIPLVRRWRVQ